jgi:hypothetical protein
MEDAAAAITAHLTPVPASSAYAHDWGIATQAVEMPAMMSCVSVAWEPAPESASAAAATATRRETRAAAGPRVRARTRSVRGEARASLATRDAPPSGEAIADAIDPPDAFRAVARQTPERGDPAQTPERGADRGPARAPARPLADAIDTNAIATVVSRGARTARARVCMPRGGTRARAASPREVRIKSARRTNRGRILSYESWDVVLEHALEKSRGRLIF